MIIAPSGYQDHFLKEAPTHQIVEQDPSLMTLRFYPDGTPFESQGDYSAVPGGHGELSHLIGNLKAKFSNFNSLHIRNIDNVLTLNEDNFHALKSLESMFFFFKTLLDRLRTSKNTTDLETTLKNQLPGLHRDSILNQIFGNGFDPSTCWVEHFCD